MQIQTMTGDWQFRQAGAEEWLPAHVPGGVHTDLLAIGRIPDPFAGDNEKRVQWVAESDWEYRRGLTCSPEMVAEDQVWLVCDGLDTLATISLNGVRLGFAENMFRRYRWEVKRLLNEEEENELVIRFASPLKFVEEKQAVRRLPGSYEAIPGGPYLRKAPSQFGWDWGPQLPPIGIWKDIRLEGYSEARLDEVHLRQEHANGQVIVSAQVMVEQWGEAPLQAMARLTAPDGVVLEAGAPVSAGSPTEIRILVDPPQLWWPNGYGEQPLYQVEVSLYNSNSDKAAPLDQRKFQLGLRTIELRQKPDAWGRSFMFVVNGVPVFAKGSNWIPADSFPTRITDEQLEWLVRSAAETHQNMLRVWGGGFYEDEHFYDLCDRYGLLVWQDFIFACSIYPLNDPAFLENVQVEVVENIRRLRHRASLALWCGNNEMEKGWVEWAWQDASLKDLKDAYNLFFHETLPNWCAAEDPDHSYWPSSPSSGTPFEDPDGQHQGDMHFWDVWHKRAPFTAYRNVFPRFMSEFGFQALPPLETVRTYAEPADWNLTSYIMEQHQKNASGNGLIIAQMAENFRLPKDFPALVYLSMVLQSEGIRYGVEHWRRNKERVHGTLYWQLNDCWPVASWSSMDYFGRWKALHYAARRFYAPLLLSIEDHPSGQDVFITSDLSETWEGEIHWSLETLDGDMLNSGKEPVKVAPYESIRVCSLDFSEQLSGDRRRELVFVAEVLQAGNRLSMQIATFVPTKHLALADPEVTARLDSTDGNLIIDLKAQSLARLVEISLEGEQVIFSDNYFDLPAGREVKVFSRLPAGWTVGQARQALKIRSVYDSYAH